MRKVIFIIPCLENLKERAVVSGSFKNPIKIINDLNEVDANWIEKIIYVTGEGDKKLHVEQIKIPKLLGLKLFIKPIIQSVLIAIHLLSYWDKPLTIQCHHPSIALFVAFLNKRNKKWKLILKAHGTAIPELKANNYNGLKNLVLSINSRIMLVIDRFSLKNSDVILISSRFQEEELHRIYKIRAGHPIKTIYNGFSPQFVTNQPKIKNSFVVCARVVPKKNILYAVELFKRIEGRKKGYFTLNLILGKSSEIEDKKYYNLILKAIENERNIQIHHDLNEVELYQIIGQSEYALIPSIGYESIPTVLFEFIGSRVKVFSTYKWGIKEVIHQSQQLTLDLEKDTEIIDKNYFHINPIQFESKKYIQQYIDLYE